ncbi:PaaX family transcriptional regulator [Mycobacterium florentinum]|uniref:PaaX family transcriptional regulator n=1 Tax=Mycobacterium florentinum TaxID=292462 RepID=A0A1X1UKM5_MYCFL|nr:PaaX family transcriptional regulator [Mycobacterium florentinum]ORV57393.1 PaaX family transcriptional regulator [Mycobacterium florentinum]BBX80818.1 PaaX family transcriptional regulator [Mycobacterium florentinum]
MLGPREDDVAGVSRRGGGADKPPAVIPSVSRRHQVGDPSTRSLLMTILGEFVLPTGQHVWTATLVQALTALGIEEGSARQALARTAAQGWLSSERVGRRTRWLLTDAGRRLLVEGAHRIYTFGSDEPSWDGHWFVVLVSIPESMRVLRHKLRAQLSWAGFGSPSPGVWISPRTAVAAEAKDILDNLDLSSKALSFVAEYGALGSERDMVNSAWDLAEIDCCYQEFITEFSGLKPTTPDDVFVAQIRLVHEWRRFPFLDPQLPPVLLPSHWSGTPAARLFQDQHQHWHERAQRRWREFADEAE